MSQNRSCCCIHLEKRQHIAVTFSKDQDIPAPTARIHFTQSPKKVIRPAFVPSVLIILVVPALSAAVIADINAMGLAYKCSWSEKGRKDSRWQGIRFVPTYSSLLFLSLPDNEFQRGSLKAKGIPDLIFQIPDIRKVHQFFVVYKDHKCRRFHRYLCDIDRASDVFLCLKAAAARATASVMISLSTPVCTRSV